MLHQFEASTKRIVGGFTTKSKICLPTFGRHMLSMTKVLGYGEQYTGLCENCGLPLTVQGAAWVSEEFTVVEELDVLEELR